MEEGGELRPGRRLQAGQRPGAGLVGDRQREAAQVDQRDGGESQQLVQHDRIGGLRQQRGERFGLGPDLLETVEDSE